MSFFVLVNLEVLKQSMVNTDDDCPDALSPPEVVRQRVLSESVQVSSKDETRRDSTGDTQGKEDKPLAGQQAADAAKQEKSRKYKVFLFVSSTVVAVLSLFVYLFAPWVENLYIVHKVSITSRDSFLWDAWISPSDQGIPMFREFHFFNITNAKDVLLGIPPIFQIIGPYSYEERRVKNESSVMFHPESGTVSYTYYTNFLWNDKDSVDRDTGRKLHENDAIVMLNGAIYGIAERLGRLPDVIYDGSKGGLPITKDGSCTILSWVVNSLEAISPTSLFVPVTAHELLWGYVDPIWESVRPMMEFINYTAAIHFRTEWNMTNLIPSPYTYRSGQKCPLWDDLTECNNSMILRCEEKSGDGWHIGDEDTRKVNRANGPYEPIELDLDNGIGSMNRFVGTNDSWWWGHTWGDGLSDTPIIEPSGYIEPPANAFGPGHRRRPRIDVTKLLAECRAVHGSDGMRFSPINRVRRDRPLTTYMDMMYRHFQFDYMRDSVVRGIDALRFGLSRADVVVPASITEADSDELYIAAHRNHLCFQMEQEGFFNMSRVAFGPGYVAKAMFLDTKLEPWQMNFSITAPAATVRKPPPPGASLRTSADGERWVTLGLEDYFQWRYNGRNSSEYREAFESYLDVHPLTGVSLQASAKGMGMMIMQPVTITGCKTMPQSKHLPKTLYPAFWAERRTVVSEHWASVLRRYLFEMHLMHWMLVASAAFFTVVAVVTATLLARQRAAMRARQFDLYGTQ